MKLVRNMKTTVVHRPECERRGWDSRPWTYATLSTLDEVAYATAQYPWLHLCRVCLPDVCCCGKCTPKADVS